MGPPDYAAMAERLWPRVLDLVFGGAAAAVALLALLCAAAFVVEAVAEARALRALGVRTRPWPRLPRALRGKAPDASAGEAGAAPRLLREVAAAGPAPRAAGGVR